MANKTGGIFNDRQELEKRVVKLKGEDLSTKVISQRCGISTTVVREIIKESQVER